MLNPDQLILWNPATREVKVLPSPLGLPSELDLSAYGFGIDPNSNDYIVVCISKGMNYFHEDDEENQMCLAEIYNLSSNSWRMIDILVPTFDFEDPLFNINLNGIFHWLFWCGDEKSILCFDLSTEVFSKMELPPETEDNTSEVLVNFNLAVINDCMAYIKEYDIDHELSSRIEIWVMDDYGVEAGWSRRFSIGLYLGQW